MTPILHFNMMKRRSRLGLAYSLILVGMLAFSGNWDEAAGKWLAFGSICAAVVFALYQIPGAARVSLDGEGISIRSPFWKQRLDWRNLGGFVLVDFGRGNASSPGNCCVGYLVSEVQKEATPDESLKVFAPLGCHGVLPQVDGIAPGDLVLLLNGALRARERAKAPEAIASPS